MYWEKNAVSWIPALKNSDKNSKKNSNNTQPIPHWCYFSSMAEKCKQFWKLPNTCHVDIHWRTLTEYYHMSMSTHTVVSVILFIFSHTFVLTKLTTSSQMIYANDLLSILICWKIKHCFSLFGYEYVWVRAGFGYELDSVIVDFQYLGI